MNIVKEFGIFDKGIDISFENDNSIFICFDKILYIKANKNTNRIIVVFGYSNDQSRGVTLNFSETEKFNSIYSILITR